MRSCVLIVLAGIVLRLSSAAGAEEACGTCHPNVKTEYAKSIHAREFSCTGCHGGDPAAFEAEVAHSVVKGYRGKLEWLDIPAMCASCHAEPNRMKSFALPTDQYAQYQTSGHGMRLAQGDTRVAVCTDCHGSHAILPPQEPTSPTSRRNVVETCGRCHSDQALMAQYQLPADQAEKYRRSVHGIALFEEEHPLAPTCPTCHGAHGAQAPQITSINMVCGRCHSRTRGYFNEGPHRKAADDGQMSECVSCHGYHETARPDHALFDTTCPACHAPGSSALVTAQQLKTVLSQAEEDVATASGEIDAAMKLSPTITRYRPRLQQGWAYFMEALPVQHALALDWVTDLTRNARSISDEVRAGVHGVEQESSLRYVWLAAVWVYVLFAVATMYLYRRETQRRRSERDSTRRDQ